MNAFDFPPEFRTMPKSPRPSVLRPKRTNPGRSPIYATCRRRRSTTPSCAPATEGGSWSRMRSGDVVGALVVRRREPGEFPQAVVSLMQTFAEQSAIALENARLFNEIAQKSRELDEWADVDRPCKSRFRSLRQSAAILAQATATREGWSDAEHLHGDPHIEEPLALSVISGSAARLRHNCLFVYVPCP
jgi:hypothetical protein